MIGSYSDESQKEVSARAGMCSRRGDKRIFIPLGVCQDYACRAEEHRGRRSAYYTRVRPKESACVLGQHRRSHIIKKYNHRVKFDIGESQHAEQFGKTHVGANEIADVLTKLGVG